MNRHRLIFPAAAVLVLQQLPLGAQDPKLDVRVVITDTATAQTATSRSTTPTGLSGNAPTATRTDTIDKSWPELECAPTAARARRVYNHAERFAGHVTEYRNQNGLVEYQQKLADALACQKESDLVLRTGVDFTSADGFVGKNADLRASVAYNISLGARWMPLLSKGRVARLAVTMRAERLSTFVERAYFGCAGSTEPRTAGATTEIPNLPRYCALPAVANDSATQTVYRPTRAPFRPNDYTIKGSWNVSSLWRYETPLFNNTSILLGPAVSVSFSTDPTLGTRQGLATSFQGGVTLRQFGSNNLERFSLLALVGRLYQFRQNVYSYDSVFVKAHPEVALLPGAKTTSNGVDVELGMSSRTNRGMSLQMMFQPVPSAIPNLYFRGSADFPNHGHRSASLAVLLQGDLATLLKGLGVTSTPSTQESATKD